MASWRTKGYVSDSDDDCECIGAAVERSPQLSKRFLAQNAHRPPTISATVSDDGNDTRQNNTCKEDSILGHVEDRVPRTTDNPAISTVERLEKCLNQGLELVRDTLGRSAFPAAEILFDDDSPLSSPPTSPALSLIHSTDGAAAKSIPAQDVAIFAPERNLRQRSAIQRNPYSLEYARYLQHCAERGIKPVNLPRATSPHRHRKHEDSQDSQFRDETQDGQPLLRDSMEIDEMSTSNTTDHLNSSLTDDFARPIDTGEDLPDLHNLFQKKPSRRLMNRTKDAASKPHELGLPVNDIFWDLPSDDTPADTVVQQRSRYKPPVQKHDSIPSPPSSYNSAQQIVPPASDSETFDKEPDTLPTPVTSSGLKRRRRFVVEDDSQEGVDTLPTHVILASSDSDSSSSEEDNSLNIRLMQKKVKGVLPASWLSIDRLQKELIAKQKATYTNKAQRQTPGVAQRRTVAKTSRDGGALPRQNAYSDLISDNESDSVSQHQTIVIGSVSGNNSHQSTVSDERQDSEAIEIFDDGGFDPMLAPRTWTRKRRKQSQANLDGFVQKTKVSDTFSSRTPTVKAAKSYSRGNGTKKRASLSSSPENLVHVLDAPDLRQPPSRPLPSFLRVAARQARNGGNGVGISASRKFFQLEDDEDPSDAMADFRAWKTKKSSNRSGDIGRDSDASRNPHDVNSESRAVKLQHHQLKSVLRQSSDAKLADVRVYPADRDIGHVIRCDSLDDEAHKLRLTRLRALLPLMNRAGVGRLVQHGSHMRMAHVEAPQLPRRSLISPRIQSPIRAGKRGIFESHDIVQGGTRTTVSSPVAIQNRYRRPRKTTPKPRSNTRHTTIIPHDPQTDELSKLVGQAGPYVRLRLEQEFAEHQAAWFQGSKSGFTVASKATQLHFQVFLDVLKSYLPIALQDAEDAQSARDVKSFVHRLIPNRGQIGAHGQVGNKTLEVLEFDVLVARNVFELHTCLLILAPGCAPRPRVLEMKVNFSDAHNEICLVTLSAWEALFDAHLNEHSLTQEMANWIHSMLDQLVLRWKLAETDARNDAINSVRRIDEQVISSVIEHNREQACLLLEKVLTAVRQRIKDATTQAEADSLLDVTRYGDLLHSICRIQDVSDRVPLLAMQLPTTFVLQQWHLKDPAIVSSLLFSVRQAIGMLTSTRDAIASQTLSAMAQTYFFLAKNSILLRQRSWDDFFEPRSSLTPDMFVSEKHLDCFKSWFHTLIVQEEHNQYVLELRVPVLSHWLAALFRERADVESTVALTLALFRHEQDSLAIAELARRFKPSGSELNTVQLEAQLSAVRHATAIHVIAWAHAQEGNAEGDWMPGGLEDRDTVSLLRIIFSTMQETWSSLREQPEEQEIYQILIHEALDHYETHPRRDFTIDPWFYNPAVFPPRRKKDLAKLLADSTNFDNDALRQAMQLFDEEITHAIRYDRLDRLQGLIHDAIFRIGPEHNMASEKQSDRHVFLTNFIQLACSNVLNKEGTQWTPVRTIALKTLVGLLYNLECIFDTFEVEKLPSVLQTILQVTATLRVNVAAEADINRRLIFNFAESAFAWATSVLSDIPDDLLRDIGAICDVAINYADCEDAISLLHAVMNADKRFV